MQAIGFYTFFSIAWLLAWLPLRVMYGISGFFFVLIFHVFGYRKDVVYNNLRNSFPQKSEEEIDAIAQRFYRYFTDVFVESIKGIHFTPKDFDKRMTIKGVEHCNKVFEENRSCILMLAHYGNWEWTRAMGLSLKHELLAVYHPMKNKYFDRYVRRLRQQLHASLIAMRDTYKVLYEGYEAGRLTATGFISDQSPPRGKGYWTTFLNQDTAFFEGGAKIAQKTNSAIIYMTIRRKKRGYYEMTLTPMFDQPRNATTSEIIERYIEITEELIHEAPEYWLWTHRRWKRKRPSNSNQCNA